jgi:hypothetical protein
MLLYVACMPTPPSPQGEASTIVVSGSSNSGATIATDEKYHGLMTELGSRLMLACREYKPTGLTEEAKAKAQQDAASVRGAQPLLGTEAPALIYGPVESKVCAPRLKAASIPDGVGSVPPTCVVVVCRDVAFHVCLVAPLFVACRALAVPTAGCMCLTWCAPRPGTPTMTTW